MRVARHGHRVAGGMLSFEQQCERLARQSKNGETEKSSWLADAEPTSSGQLCALLTRLPRLASYAALVAYHLANQAGGVQADLAALPAGHVVAIRGWKAEKWATTAVLAPLTALTELQLGYQAQLNDGNQLVQILQPLGQLRNLSMTVCQLTAVPAAVSCCTQLVHLDLGRNELAGGWQHLQPLVQLQYLSLSHAAQLPTSMPLLPQLTRLDLSYCGTVPAFSDQSAALHRLRALDLTMCFLTEVPAAVAALTALTLLQLGFNQLAGGFDHLRPLAQLQVLWLHANDLAEVPPVVAALTALQHLSLGNPQSGWQHLRPLAQLQSLDEFSGLYIDTPKSHLLLASEAAANLHPDAVQRMLAEPNGELPYLLDLLAARGLPRPV